MPDALFDGWVAERYEVLWPELFEPDVVRPAVDFLVRLAGGGPVLEFGVGTGRLAVPVSRAGVRVHGVELSPAMARRVREHDGGDRVGVTVGDFAHVDADGPYQVVYLVRNTITNVTTQDAQVDTFRNAARHLEPGGCFVVENYIPELQRLPPGQTVHVFSATPEHLAFEEYDLAAQIAVSHHYWFVDGEVRNFSSPHRYVWPAELDLMARLAGLTLRERWAGWGREPFTGTSRAHVSVWEKPGHPTAAEPDTR